MRVVYQFPLSPFCEKVRWMLDYKELHYVAKNKVMGLHQPFALYHTKQTKLPILQDGKIWLADSIEIAHYLDEIYVEYPLILDQYQAQIAHLTTRTQLLGRCVRYCLLYYLLQDEQNGMLKILLGEKGVIAKYHDVSDKLLYSYLRQYLKSERMSIHYSEQKMYQLLNEFDLALREKTYLCGHQFSLADMALASMLAPLLNIENTPWHLPYQQSYPSDLQIHTQYLQNMALANYVHDMYKRHRHARVDWRGV